VIAEGSKNGLPEALGFASAFYELPGLRMHAAVAGPEGGPLVVLLHGFPEFWYSWRFQIGPLAAAGLRVVAPDQRGYNLTDKSPPYDVDTLVGDIDHLITACGRTSAHVAGHDWGAGIAWGLAAAYPERVERLAILNVPHPGPFSRGLRGGDVLQILRSWYILAFQIPGWPERFFSRRDFTPLARLLRDTANPGTFTDLDLERYKTAWRQPGALSAMIGWYRALVRIGPRPELVERYVRRILAPTLILWGDRDLALRAALAEQSVGWCDDGRLIRYPQATHWVHQDLPEEINRQILAHFRDS
jgi:pimeloyl-ACP methyl ester carboxylesterase